MSVIKEILKSNDFEKYIEWARDKYGISASRVPIPFVLLELILNTINQNLVVSKNVTITNGKIIDDDFKNLSVDEVKKRFILYYEGENLISRAIQQVVGNELTLSFAYNGSAVLIKLY